MSKPNADHTEAKDPTAAPAAEAAAPAAEPTAEVVKEPITLSPTSISGTQGTPVSGQFSVIGGGAAPFTFSVDGAVGDFQVAEDGFYCMNPTSSMTGTVNVTATDVDGVKSDPTAVTIAIS